MDTVLAAASPVGGLMFTTAVAALSAGYFIRQLCRARDSRRWPTAEGRILSSINESFMDKTRARIEYEYRVNDRTIRGRRVSFLEQADGPDSFKLVLRYAEGQAVKVHYSPDDPELAVLEPGAKPASYVIVAILVPIVLLLLGVTIAEMLERP